MEKLAEKYLKLIREIEKLKEPTSSIIRTHLYLEYSLNETIKFVFQDCSILNNNAFSFYLKIQTLKGLGILDNTSYQNAKLINEIRNQFAHNLDPNEEKIKNKISILEHNLDEDEWNDLDNPAKIRSVTMKIMMNLMIYQKNKLIK